MHVLTVWIAIDNSTPENGCLKMIPGSHRIPLAPPDVAVSADDLMYVIYTSGSTVRSAGSRRRRTVSVPVSASASSIHAGSK